MTRLMIGMMDIPPFLCYLLLTQNELCFSYSYLFEQSICMPNRSTVYSRYWRVCTVFAAALGVLCVLSGCVSPIALHQAVLEYDRTTAKIQAEMLLLNIARAKHQEPLHFTAVSSVAATFNFQVSAGILTRLADNPGTGSAASLTLGASASENPTITIIPVEGRDFTQRILTPLFADNVLFLSGQGVDPSLIARLLCYVYVDTRGKPRRLLNDPRFKNQYMEFRRIVLHIASLRLVNLIGQQTIQYNSLVPTPYPTDSRAPETTDTVISMIKEGYSWQSTEEESLPVLTRTLKSRRIIANYDPSDLSNDQRGQLYQEVERLPENAIFLDIRSDGPGGEYPLHGYFLLRSFSESLRAIAKRMSANPEFAVEKDPRTGPIPLRNPIRALTVQETAEKPSDALFHVQHAGSWYWMAKAPENASESAAWDQIAFRLLNAVYNMTVTDLSDKPKPVITIAK